MFASPQESTKTEPKESIEGIIEMKCEDISRCIRNVGDTEGRD